MVIADLQKEFWSHVTFHLTMCVINSFEKFTLVMRLSDLTLLIRNFTSCVYEQVVKKYTKILLIKSIQKPPALFR